MGTARVPRLSLITTQNLIRALVAELADAYGSGPYFLTEVQVQVLSGAPNNKNPNPKGSDFCFKQALFFQLSAQEHCSGL